jgi:hypothetical protein
MTTLTLHASYLAALMHIAAEYGCLDSPFEAHGVTDDMTLVTGIDATIRLKLIEKGASGDGGLAGFVQEYIKFITPAGHVAYIRVYLSVDGDVEYAHSVTYES